MRLVSAVLMIAIEFPWSPSTAGTLMPNTPPEAVEPADVGLAAIIADPRRTPRFVARDASRHPLQELGFFEVTPNSTVVEVWPGGGYWTELLAPYLRDHGRYIVALQAPVGSETTVAEARRDAAALRAKLAADPKRFGLPTLLDFGVGHLDIGEPGSVDCVLTFRNLHNWMDDGVVDSVLAAFFRVLKPGGVLGVEEHRGRPDRPQDPRALSGYVRQDYAVALVEQAGFKLDGTSEIGANPYDTTDWPAGVWTLPPTLRLGEQDRAKYLAVGEADNFVLRFRKPR